MKRVVIGTAGHIDHGKTTLVKALTGIDTDRLKEEKQRGISIELGFAPLRLPSGQVAAIVDVPGHERFIRHMLAGASGVDAVMLVVAADEGIMPQTREHVDIIELLGVDRGVVVITKKDLVDEEWLMLVEEEIQEFLRKSILRHAPVVAVSAVTGEGIDTLLQILQELTSDLPERAVIGKARLPIDRVFSMTGFGTVVTGTLWSGRIRVGDSMEVLPPRLPTRVRTLQVHGQKVEEAEAGQRVAVNLQGLELSDVQRGFVVCTPGFLSATHRLDATIRLLSSSPRTIRNWNRIRFHLGTGEALGRVVLLDRDELLPGEEAYAQIVLESPMVAARNDRFVIRFYSPMITVGGGKVIDPHPPKQKRFREDVLARLAVKEEGSLGERVLQELEQRGDDACTRQEIAARVGADDAAVGEELDRLVEGQEAIRVELEGKSFYLARLALEQMEAGIQKDLEAYHRRYPLRKGLPREELRSRHLRFKQPKLAAAMLQAMEDRGALVAQGNSVALPGFEPRPTPVQQQAIEILRQAFAADLFSPPTPKEVAETEGIDPEVLAEVLAFMLETGELVKVGENALFLAEAVEEGKRRLDEFFTRERELSLAAARDIFQSSRKHALPLMEYYDRIRYTRRVGDMRVRNR